MQVTNDTSSPCYDMSDGDMQAAMTTWVQVTAGGVRQDTAYWDKIRGVRAGGCRGLGGWVGGCGPCRAEAGCAGRGAVGCSTWMLGLGSEKCSWFSRVELPSKWTVSPSITTLLVQMAALSPGIDNTKPLQRRSLAAAQAS